MTTPTTTGTNRISQKQSVEFAVLESLRPTAGTAVSGAATLNQGTGRVTSESLTTAAGATYTLTLTNSVIDASGNAMVLAAVHLGTATTGMPAITTVTPGNGQVVIIVQNIHATAALNGTIVIDFMVVRQGPAPL